MNGKYKVWHKKEKRWLDYQVMLQSGRVGEIAEDCSVVCHKDADVAVCFSTNLKDKNGKEIYEGDIVNSHYEKTEQYEAYDEVGVVEWSKDAWGWLIADNLHGKNNRYQPFCEVIGNIYENPELLK